MATNLNEGTIIFGHCTKRPEAFGVAEFDKEWKVLSIEEKPENPKSNYIVPGLYFCDNDVIEIAKNVKPSEEYLMRGKLKVELLGRGMAWLDSAHMLGFWKLQTLLKPSKRQGLYIACLRKSLILRGYITTRQLLKTAENLKKTDYGE